MEGGQRSLHGVRGSVEGFDERVLIVDDDQGFRSVLEIRLGQEGAVTCCAASGEEAVAVLESFGPSLVIADLMMPGMDGLALCRHIRGDPRHRRLPILILTSADHSGDVGEVVGLGLIWYMRKGAEWPTVMRSLRNLVARGEELQTAS